jgi:replicative DNA helicase
MKDLFSIQLEKQIIGALLNDRDSYIHAALEIGPNDFYNPELARICQAFADEYGKGSQYVDLHSLSLKSGVRAEILAECMEVGWFSADMRHKCRKLADLASKRRTYKECANVLNEMSSLENEELSARLSDIAFSINSGNERKKIYNAGDLISRVKEIQDERKKDPGYIRGIRTGYNILDQSIKGLRSKRMTVIAAATGFGKTTLALNLLGNIAIAGHKALFISCENDADDNLDRLCGIVSGLDLKDVESGANSPRVLKHFQDAFNDKTLFLSDNSPRTIEEVCATISRYAIQHQIEIAFVDYIGEISGESKDRETEEMKLARYAQKILDTAKSMNVHVVVLSQLNRQGNQKGRPTKTELAGCFRLAQKSHSLLIFWQDEGKEHGPAQDVLTIDKNRQGPAGIDIAVSFNRSSQKVGETGVWLASSKVVQPIKGT